MFRDRLLRVEKLISLAKLLLSNDTAKLIVLLEQLQNSHNNIIDIAKSRSFKLFSMMQSTSPVDSYVTHLGKEGRER